MIETHNWRTEQFEVERPRLRAMAYRMLGSLAEAEDAVQETWLHLSRCDTSMVSNLAGWLTTVVARVCLNMLHARKARREDSLEALVPAPMTSREREMDPQEEAELAEAVGLALLVVLDTLAPTERIAFVLHDIFAVPFDEIAPLVERSPIATRQLASRARRRMRGSAMARDADLPTNRAVVDAFLAAAREGSFDKLLAALAPDIVFRADDTAVAQGALREVYGAQSVVRGARQLLQRIPSTQSVLVDGAVGIVVAPHGRLLFLLCLTIREGKITAIDAIADPVHLRHLHLAVLPD